MSTFVENQHLTPLGSRLIRLIDEHIASRSGMTEELRHYSAAVYKTHLMKPSQWLEKYPEKADALWAYFAPEQSDDDDDQPPTTGIQPWLIKK
ncbi:MAG: hypothetical protein ABI970_20915 [Chloroflexota bacterium]